MKTMIDFELNAKLKNNIDFLALTTTYCKNNTIYSSN